MSRAKPLKMYNRRTKPIIIDRAMIELRDRLAAERGYVKRLCSLGPLKSGVHHLCWERDQPTVLHDGRIVPFYHATVEHDQPSCVYRYWPSDVMDAAATIDGEHRARKKPTGDD
jgi:hypothetical protein